MRSQITVGSVIPGRVSYLVAAYNHRAYLQRCIDSILDQTYADVELLVCDDASNDGSREFLEAYATKRKFTLFINTENRGASSGLNRMIAAATGEYLGFVASDDWIEAEKTAEQVAFLRTNGVDAVLAPVKVFDETTGQITTAELSNLEPVIREGRYLERLYQTDSGGAMTQSGLFRREAVAAIGGFREEYRSDDWLLMIRFLQAGYRVGFMTAAYTVYRLHANNSHKNALYCLHELQLPVINDFVPFEYRSTARASVYHTCAMKLLNTNAMQAAVHELRSQREKAGWDRLSVFIRSLVLSWTPLRNLYISHLRPLRARFRGS